MTSQPARNDIPPRAKRPKPQRRRQEPLQESRPHESQPSSAPDTPLDYALRVMRDETMPAGLRVSVARTAMPFLHARRPPKEPPPPPLERPKMSPIEIARRIAFILHEGAKEEERRLGAGGEATKAP